MLVGEYLKLSSTGDRVHFSGRTALPKPDDRRFWAPEEIEEAIARVLEQGWWLFAAHGVQS
jgi:hypothetical protein